MEAILKLLAAPFRNRIHLVTIVVIALLFGAFRLSGGDLDVRSKHRGSLDQAIRGESKTESPRPSRVAASAPNELDELIAGDEEAFFDPQAQMRRLTGDTTNAGVSPPARTAPRGGSSIDDLIDVRGATQPPPPKRPQNSGGLNDIEKLIGLR